MVVCELEDAFAVQAGGFFFGCIKGAVGVVEGEEVEGEVGVAVL